MGEIHTGILVTRKAGDLNAAVKVNFKDLFKALSAGALHVGFENWAGATQKAVQAVGAIGVRKDPGEQAWLLIHGALTQAVWELVGGNFGLLSKPREDFAGFCDSIGDSLEEHLIVIDDKFFERPGEAPFVQSFSKGFEQWLTEWGFGEAPAQAAAARLPSYFTFALNDRWRAAPDDYSAVQEALDTPFTKAGKRELGWTRYAAWLNREEPVFEEAFSLKQIYVPLRACYEKKSKESRESISPGGIEGDGKKSKRTVVDLAESLDAWLNKAARGDAIRVITGGPGCGKTSFARLFAARHAEKGSVRVLFVPLHQLELSDSLITAIDGFVRYNEFLSHDPLDPEDGEQRLLLVLDGLDELSKQGVVGGQIAHEFVIEVDRQVTRFNSAKTRLQILLCGRPVAVQECSASLREPGQVLNVLSYTETEDEKHDLLEDPKGLLDGDNADQRQLWWRQYGQLTGRGYSGLPNELAREELNEISAQPLLNYLLALSYVRGEVDFGAPETNRNKIYEDLISAVYDRKKWAGKQHRTLEGLSDHDFLRVLEEITVAVWHGDGRTATIREIEKHCAETGVGRLLKRFQKGAEAGVTRLLTAFYFRQVGQREEGDRTFEFTHKSFGEYLTARRILREVDRMSRQLAAREDDPDDGWDEREALRHWVQVSGPTAIDDDVNRFLADESRIAVKEKLRGRHKMLCALISFRLRHGMPIERVEPRPRVFQEEMEWCRNADEAMLVVRSWCAGVLQEHSQIEAPRGNSFGSWVKFMQGQRIGGRNRLSMSALDWIKVGEPQRLEIADLYRANLSRTNLRSVSLIMANLHGADLEGADLEGAHLIQANLQRANLQRANLEGVYLQEADLQGANLQGANLRGALVGLANLQRADLEGADLEGAHLIQANLKRANLKRANLKGANLKGANLKGANLDPGQKKLARTEVK